MDGKPGKTGSRLIRQGLCILVITALAPALQAGVTARFEGAARDPQTGDLLYTETHQVAGECDNGTLIPHRQKVAYKTPDGRQRATKTLDYGKHPLRPGFTKTDRLFDERMEVRVANGRAFIRWDQPGEAPEVRHEAPLPESAVIDAAFDVLIRQELGRLRAGESITFQFLAPTRGSFYEFIAEPVPRHKAIEASLVVRVRPAGFILRWLVDPLYLGYDRHGRLSDYRGLTNIRKNSETNYQAHIHYRHGPDPCALTPAP